MRTQAEHSQVRRERSTAGASGRQHLSNAEWEELWAAVYDDIYRIPRPRDPDFTNRARRLAEQRLRQGYSSEDLVTVIETAFSEAQDKVDEKPKAFLVNPTHVWGKGFEPFLATAQVEKACRRDEEIASLEATAPFETLTEWQQERLTALRAEMETEEVAEEETEPEEPAATEAAEESSGEGQPETDEKWKRSASENYVPHAVIRDRMVPDRSVLLYLLMLIRAKNKVLRNGLGQRVKQVSVSLDTLATELGYTGVHRRVEARRCLAPLLERGYVRQLRRGARVKGPSLYQVVIGPLRLAAEHDRRVGGDGIPKGYRLTDRPDPPAAEPIDDEPMQDAPSNDGAMPSNAPGINDGATPSNAPQRRRRYAVQLGW